jgi:lipoyl-dependent peroxiredoxin
MQRAPCTEKILLKDPSQIELRNQGDKLAKEISMIRKAKAVWRGTGRTGSGNLSTDSGVLVDTPYSFKTRFENEKGTNPEELIAAAHAGCFTMALAFGLQGAGFTPAELSTEAAVSLEPEGQGFRISRSTLTLRAKVPDLDETKFAQLAKDTEKNCQSPRFSTPRSCWTPSSSKAVHLRSLSAECATVW